MFTLSWSLLIKICRGRGGGGTPLYKPHWYVPHQRVWFLRRFSLKTAIHFAHFGLDLVMVFEETSGL